MDARELGAVGCELSREGRLQEAVVLLSHAVTQDPSNDEARINLAMAILAQGRLAEGAALYEARLLRTRAPALPFPRWDGTPLDGKRVVIWPEQGLGDQIMMARYVPELVRRGCTVTLVCAPALERLFKQSLDVNVLPAKGSIDLPEADSWIWAMSLLAAMRGSPAPVDPYLDAKPRCTEFRIGLATRGSPTNLNDAYRSLPQDVTEALLAFPGVGSLLPEDTFASDMLDTAEIVAGLDLVISVDTSIAHLAGALGKPVWILLPAYATDWRWQTHRTDSPWYPSARLFRQTIQGDWANVVQDVKAALPHHREASTRQWEH